MPRMTGLAYPSLLFALAACEMKAAPRTPLPTEAEGTNGGSAGSTSNTPSIDVDASAPEAGTAPTGCDGLACQQASCTAGACVQPACAAGTSTTLTGTVYDPAGKLPLYNVMVYVPNGPLSPLENGPACVACELSTERPVSTALTDTQGKFVLDDVPVGAEIPVVIQSGKWRRQIKVPVNACVDNPIVDVNLTRLPRNQTEGDIPLIAITTGAGDSMECLPRRLGIDDAEFTTSEGSGRIHLYEGGGYTTITATKATDAFSSDLNDGAALTPATELWASADSLARYDIIVLSCEGEANEQDKEMTSREAMYEYTSQGGRVLASHLHHFWFSAGPSVVPQVATWEDRAVPDQEVALATINTAFPKGQALAQWLLNVGASSVLGELEIYAARDNVQAANPLYATEWMTIQNPLFTEAPKSVQYLSFNAPLDVPAEQQCGRATYSGLHVSSTDGDKPGARFPSGCEERELSAQEKAIAFMLFDLSACVIPDDQLPEPPPVR